MSKLTKLRDELKRTKDCNNNLDVFSEWSFDSGAQLAIQEERKRAQVLVDAVNSVIFWTRDGRQDLRTHHRISKALSAYEKETAE